MPPNRGSQGYDFSPILSQYVLLFTFILAVIGWFTAFIGQCIATAKFGHATVGTAWFSIFLQAFIIMGVLHTLATDAIAMHRFQISVFTSVALVFAVIAVNQTIFLPMSSLEAVGAGWLLLAIVDIIWVFYFTSEEDSLQLHLLNSMGTGGLTPPGRHSRRATMNNRSSNIGGGGVSNNGYGGGGISSGGVGGGAYGNGPSGFDRSVPGLNNTSRSTGGGISNVDAPVGGGIGNTSAGGMSMGANAPLMSGAGANIGDTSAGSHQAGPSGDVDDSDGYAYKAKALYAYTASADDPNEISFSKGEILEILDNAGKWWQAKKSDGTRGIAPSNYLQII